MEDFVPKLQLVLKILREIDENEIDDQEMDYISGIEDYVKYMSLKYDGFNIEPPKYALFLNNEITEEKIDEKRMYI